MSLTIYVTPSARKSLWVTAEKLDVLAQRVRSFEHCVPKGQQKTVTFDDLPERAGLCCRIIGPLGTTFFKYYIMPNHDMGRLAESIKKVLSS